VTSLSDGTKVAGDPQRTPVWDKPASNTLGEPIVRTYREQEPAAGHPKTKLSRILV
jgi:hypothetical protein